MKKLLLLCLGIFLFVSSVWARMRCVNPSFYIPEEQELFLPCVTIGNSDCFYAHLYLESTQPQIIFRILSLNATGIIPYQLFNKEFVSHYEPDNQTLEIPVVFIQNHFYSAQFQLTSVDDNYALVLKEIRPSSNTLSPVCWDDLHFNPDVQNGQGSAFYEKLLYSRRIFYQGELVQCFEYVASAEKIAVLRSLPVLTIGPTTVEESFISCPGGYALGCFTYDEDGDRQAVYYYESPFSEIIIPLSCGENYYPVNSGIDIVPTL